jgi:hypothetical protein
MVNGAGLAMATMDIIKLAGGEPANFLDVGGGASVERVAAAFRVMMSDPNVKVVLINIFGGIVRCDRVANGIIQAMETVQVNIPVIVRLDGTNAEEARQILLNSPLNFSVAATLKEAAEKVNEAITGLGDSVEESAAVMNAAMASASMAIPPGKEEEEEEEDVDEEVEGEEKEKEEEEEEEEFEFEEVEDPDALDLTEFDEDDLDDDIDSVLSDDDDDF